jgi:hypothetical protein
MFHGIAVVVMCCHGKIEEQQYEKQKIRRATQREKRTGYGLCSLGGQLCGLEVQFEK